MLKIWFPLQYHWGVLRLGPDSPEYGWTPDSGSTQDKTPAETAARWHPTTR